MVVGPLTQKRILFLRSGVDHVWNDCPRVLMVKPLVAPLIIGGPIGSCPRFPHTECTVIQHDGLADLVNPPYIIRATVRHTKTSPRQS